MSAPLIPQEVENLAIQLANEEAGRAAEARSREGATAIVLRLKTEAAAAGMPVKEYIDALTRDPEGVTPPEGTSPTSAFWSHGTNHPKAPANWKGDHVLDNRYVAEAWARIENDRDAGSARTLETTEGGRRLNEMYLFEDAVRQALGGDEKGFTYEWARDCWGSISQTYAEASQGPVVVFAETAHTRSILYNRELPTLQTNPNVGLDNIHFAYAAPLDWPTEARAEIGTNTVRAQVQVDDPTLPHYVDPAAYPTQDPIARKAAVAAECASVTAERTERAAEKAGTASSATEPKAPEAETPAVEAPAQPEKPTAAVPVWQMGFKPTPVKLEADSSGPSVESVAPPEPSLGKQATGTGLG